MRARRGGREREKLPLGGISIEKVPKGVPRRENPSRGRGQSENLVVDVDYSPSTAAIHIHTRACVCGRENGGVGGGMKKDELAREVGELESFMV